MAYIADLVAETAGPGVFAAFQGNFLSGSRTVKPARFPG